MLAMEEQATDLVLKEGRSQVLLLPNLLLGIYQHPLQTREPFPQAPAK